MVNFNVAAFTARNYLSPVSSECMVEDARHEFTSPIAQAEKFSLRTPTDKMLRAPLNHPQAIPLARILD